MQAKPFPTDAAATDAPGGKAASDDAQWPAGYAEDDRVAHWRLREALAAMERAIGIGRDDVFLEIGCGAGELGQLLTPRVTTWIGCDPSAGELARAARKLLGLRNARLTETAPDGALALVGDETVDAVYGIGGFSRMDALRRSRAIREARRVLKPGGRIYVESPDLASPEGWQLFETARSLAGAPGASATLEHCSTCAELETLLTRAGFAQVRVKSWNGRLHAWGVKRS